MITDIYLSMLLRQFSVERIRQTLREAKRVISRFRPVTSDLVNLEALTGAKVISFWRRDMAADNAPRYDSEKRPADTSPERPSQGWGGAWSGVKWGGK